jgi:signal transduction histidine kinase
MPNASTPDGSRQSGHHPQSRLFWDRSYKVLITSSLRIFLPSAVILVGIVATFHGFDLKAERDQLLAGENVHVNLGKREISDQFAIITADLKVLAESGVLERFLLTDNPDTRSLLEQDYLVLVRNKQIYDQVRLLNEEGREVIRANFNDGNPIIVPEAALQDKGNRYYFADTISLEQGEVYVSPLDLNIEHGEIERPLKPMIRFGTPVYDATGDKRGIVLLNYLGGQLLEQLAEALMRINNQPILLNSEGYWLIAPNPEDAWGFMLPHNASFARQYPQIWVTISTQESGQLVTAEGVFTFTTVYPLLEGQISSNGSASPDGLDPAGLAQIGTSDYFWKVISFIPATVLWENLISHLQQAIWQSGILLLILLPASLAVGWFNWRSQVSRRQVEELRALNQLKDDFLNMVSHDLRSPLTNMKMMLQVLNQFKGEEDCERLWRHTATYLQLLEQECDRELNLVNDLLDLQRLESGRLELVTEPIQLDYLVTNTVARFEERAAARQLTLVTDIDEPLPVIHTDPDILQRILAELLTNACKYTPPGESIQVKVSQEIPVILIQVINFGSFIAPDQLPLIFDRFYRIPQGDRWQQGGTGLGLTLARKLADRLGGILAANSVPGKTTFSLRLPMEPEV